MPDENNVMTLEEAQARILELEEQNNGLTEQNTQLTEQNTQLSADLDRARHLNQELFNRVTVSKQEEEEPEEPEIPTCEEFAKTLNLF